MNSQPPSQAQMDYLHAYKVHKRKIAFYRFFILFCFLFLWEISAKLGLIDDFIFSRPSKLLACARYLMLENHLLFHIGITLSETLLSFLLVMVLSVGFTVLLWCSDTLMETLDPTLVVLNSLPKSALAPLLIVWLGATYKTIILTGMSVAIFGTVLNLYIGFREVDPEKLMLIKSLGGSRRHALFKIILPANLPNLIGLMKSNIGLCLVGVIIGEFIASRCGLGYIIIYSSQVLKMDWMLLSIFILCIIAMGFYGMTRFIEKWYQEHF